MQNTVALSMCIASALASCRSVQDRSQSSLLAADRAFCADTQTRRLEAWLAAFDEHGSQVGDDFQPVTGHAAIRERMQGLFSDSANELWWEPDAVRVSEAGKLGATTGRFQLRQRKSDGKTETVLSGRYFDVWRRLPDGSWKLLYDIGDPEQASAK